MPTPRAKRRIIAILVILLSGMTMIGGGAPATADPQHRALVWSDEFDGPHGSAPDPAKWRHDIGGHGWGNNELQYYTDSNANTFLDGNGDLVVEARNDGRSDPSCKGGRCTYTSGRLLTLGTFAHTYGRYEARIKIPQGQGIWPAFWMLGDDIATNPWPASGEIDIMENVGHEPGTLWGSIHGPDNTAANNVVNGSYTLPDGLALGDDFHTYAVEWQPDRITWYLDDVAFLTKTPADMMGGEWIYDKPFFMVLNVAVGGTWPGNPDAATTFPQRMVVDHVRVYDLSSAPAHTPAPDTATPTSTPGPSAPQTRVMGQLTGYAGKCIDVDRGAGVPGTPLHTWDCYNTLATQLWTHELDSTVRSMGLCMDTAGGGVTNGTRLELSTCDGRPSQQFTLTESADLVNHKADRCVDVTGWNAGNGASLQLWDCSGTVNQKWWVL